MLLSFLDVGTETSGVNLFDFTLTTSEYPEDLPPDLDPDEEETISPALPLLTGKVKKPRAPRPDVRIRSFEHRRYYQTTVIKMRLRQFMTTQESNPQKHADLINQRIGAIQLAVTEINTIAFHCYQLLNFHFLWCLENQVPLPKQLLQNHFYRFCCYVSTKKGVLGARDPEDDTVPFLVALDHTLPLYRAQMPSDYVWPVRDFYCNLINNLTQTMLSNFQTYLHTTWKRRLTRYLRYVTGEKHRPLIGYWVARILALVPANDGSPYNTVETFALVEKYRAQFQAEQTKFEISRHLDIFLPQLWAMLKVSEEQEGRRFCLLPRKSSLIPGHIKICNTSLADLVTKFHGGDVHVDVAKRANRGYWSEWFAVDQVGSRRRHFHHEIVTDGYAVSITLQRRRTDVQPVYDLDQASQEERLAKIAEVQTQEAQEKTAAKKQLAKNRAAEQERKAQLKAAEKARKEKAKADLQAQKVLQKAENQARKKLGLPALPKPPASVIPPSEAPEELEEEILPSESPVEQVLWDDYEQHWGLDPGKRSLFTACNDDGQIVRCRAEEYYHLLGNNRYQGKFHRRQKRPFLQEWLAVAQKLSFKVSSSSKFLTATKAMMAQLQAVQKEYVRNFYRQYRFLSYRRRGQVFQLLARRLMNGAEGRVLLGYGNGLCNGPGIKGRCVPVLTFYRYLLSHQKEKIKVVMVNEAMTTKMCSQCQSRTGCVRHHISYQKRNGEQVQRCAPIYGLRRCQNNECHKTWDRDVNSAQNHYRLLATEHCGQPRPEYLKLGTRKILSPETLQRRQEKAMARKQTWGMTTPEAQMTMLGEETQKSLIEQTGCVPVGLSDTALSLSCNERVTVYCTTSRPV